MLLVYVLLAAIPIAYIMDGRLRNYLAKPLRLVFFPCFAFMIEASFGMIGRILDRPAADWLGYAVGLEYLLLALFIIFNWSYPGVKLLGASTLVNFLVIFANGFRMPVTPLIYNNPALSGLVERIQSGELVEYVLVDWDGPLWFFGDTIPMFGGLASIGDLLMAAAVVVIICNCMKPPKRSLPKINE